MAFLGSSDNIELDLNLSSLKCSTLLFSIAPAMYPVTRHVCLILKRYTQAARLGGTYVLLQSRHELIYSEG